MVHDAAWLIESGWPKPNKPEWTWIAHTPFSTREKAERQVAILTAASPGLLYRAVRYVPALTPAKKRRKRRG